MISEVYLAHYLIIFSVHYSKTIGALADDVAFAELDVVEGDGHTYFLFFHRLAAPLAPQADSFALSCVLRSWARTVAARVLVIGTGVPHDGHRQVTVILDIVKC